MPVIGFMGTTDNKFGPNPTIRTTPIAAGALVRATLDPNHPSITNYAIVMEVFKPRCGAFRAAALFVFEGSGGFYLPYLEFEYMEHLSPGGGCEARV